MMETGLLDGMEPELLAISERGDGKHKVVKVVYNGKPLVLKLYGLKRGWIQTMVRQFLEGLGGVKSSFSASGRMETEQAVLDLWHREGFAVPQLLYPDFLAQIPQPCLAMEWVAGETLAVVLRNAEIGLEQKQELVEKFARTMGARHARALELNDCRFIPEHPTLQHILVADDRLVYFDFETVFTTKVDLERIVKYELGSHLASLAKHCKEDFFVLGRTFVTTYPDREFLTGALDDLQTFGTIPISTWLTKFPIYFRCSSRYRTKAHAARFFSELLQ